MSQHVPVIVPDMVRRLPGLIAGMSTRVGGVSAPPLSMNLSFSVGDDEHAVRANRELFFGSLGVDVPALAFPRQVHSSTIRRVAGPGAYADCDALLTGTPGVFACVTVADCVPVLLADPATRSVAAIHAGWRGAAGGIVGEAVRRMETTFGSRPPDLRVFVGPSARRCCYEVGEEVAAKFDDGVLVRSNGRLHLDLSMEVCRQLLAAGVNEHSVEVSPSCTICIPRLFHSHRRDGSRSGRMMAVIGFQPGS